MARVDVTTDKIVRDGLVLAPTAPTIDGDVIDAGNTALFIENVSAGPETVTVLATATQDGLALENQITTIAAGDTALLGPWPKRTFGQPAGANESGGDDEGRVYVDYSIDTAFVRQVVAF